MDILDIELDLIKDEFFISKWWFNVLILEADMSSSTHIDNKRKYILVFGKGPTQVLEHTLTAEKMYAINFTVKKKKLA